MAHRSKLFFCQLHLLNTSNLTNRVFYNLRVYHPDAKTRRSKVTLHVPLLCLFKLLGPCTPLF
jgi:hypothetical protein